MLQWSNTAPWWCLQLHMNTQRQYLMIIYIILLAYQIKQIHTLKHECVFCTYILIKYLTMHFDITLFDKLSITHHTKKNFAFSHSRYISYPGRGWLIRNTTKKTPLQTKLSVVQKKKKGEHHRQLRSHFETAAADSCEKKAVKFRICGKVPWQRWLCSVQRWRLQLQWLWLPKLLRSTCREENQGHQEKDQCY